MHVCLLFSLSPHKPWHVSVMLLHMPADSGSKPVDATYGRPTLMLCCSMQTSSLVVSM